MHLNSAFGACCVVFAFCSSIPDAFADIRTVARCFNEIGQAVVIRYDQVGQSRRITVEDPMLSRNPIFRGNSIAFSSAENEVPGIQQFAGFQSPSMVGAWIFPDRSQLQFQYNYQTKAGQLIQIADSNGRVAWRSLYLNCDHTISR